MSDTCPSPETILRDRLAALERELAEARAERDEGIAALIDQRDQARAELVTARAEVERAFIAGYRTADWPGPRDEHDLLRESAAWSRYQQERGKG